MDKTTKIIGGVIIGVMLIFIVVQTFQLNTLKNSITGNAVSSGGAIDTSGWTAQEKMEYEHHGTLPARLNKGSTGSSGSGGMVGGC